MKIVIDCNVPVSATRTDGVRRSVVDAAVRSHDIVLSEPVVAEYMAVAARSKHTAYRHALRAAIGDMERIAVFVEPANVVFELGYPDDEVYPTTATERVKKMDDSHK